MIKKIGFRIALLLCVSGSVWATPSSTFVFNAQSTPDIVRALKFARENQKSVIVQSTAQNNPLLDKGVVYLNLHDFKELITLYLKKKIMLVESGMTWNEAQQLLTPYNLSLKFIPAHANDPIFQTINENRSGLSPQNAWVADGIASIRLLQPDGQIITVSRDATPELWRGLFGSGGVLGVILDVKLKLVENRNLIRHAARLSLPEYIAAVHEQAQANADIRASFARVDVASGKNFLNDLYVVNYWVKDGELADSPHLHPVRNRIADSLYQWSKKGDWEKRLRWQMETALLGNNALHPELTQADLLLRQSRMTDSASGQVYYIPATHFVAFMEDFRTLAKTQKWAFNQISVHYLEKPSDLLLAPKQGDMIALSIHPSKISSAEQKSLLPDLALKYEGGFALTEPRPLAIN